MGWGGMFLEAIQGGWNVCEGERLRPGEQEGPVAPPGCHLPQPLTFLSQRGPAICRRLVWAH